MTKCESADLSLLEKTMSVMVNILKLSALPLARIGAKQPGRYNHGKPLPAGNRFLTDQLLPARPARANRRPQTKGQPLYLMEPDDGEVGDKLTTVNPPTCINERADEYIRGVRRRMEQKEDVGSEDVLRKPPRSSTNYKKVVEQKHLDC